MGTLEGQLAGGQGRHQAVAFISTQAVIEFDCTCLMAYMYASDSYEDFSVKL